MSSWKKWATKKKTFTKPNWRSAWNKKASFEENFADDQFQDEQQFKELDQDQDYEQDEDQDYDYEGEDEDRSLIA